MKLVAEGNELCFLCHDNKKPQGKATNVSQHPPTVEGECLACHDPHGSQYKFLLQGPVEQVSNTNLCFTCHDNIAGLTKKKTVHGALEMGCRVCHQTHKGGNPSEQQFAYHLVKSAPSLCLECHDGKDWQLVSAHAGQPFQNAACTGCHNPHGSDRVKLIRAQAHPPFAEKQCDVCHEEPKNGKVSLVEQGKKELCFACHDDKKELLAKAKVKHSYFEIDETCTTCHSPHASDQPKCPRIPLRTMNDRGHPLMQHPVSGENKLIPEKGNLSCVSCHKPHGIQLGKKLVEAKGRTQAICLDCHGNAKSQAEVKR